MPNCTKDKAKNPLGVCSVFHDGAPAITCPIRFREDWLITDDAASFFFPEGSTWSSLTEVRLNDANGKTAGNIDVVLVSYDESGKVLDFGALEIQAVYISGNVRDPFEYYMKDPKGRTKMDWSDQPNYPRPDYLSSSRKRLVPQLLFKGGILHSWKKKSAVALNKSFFDTLPRLAKVPKSKADIEFDLTKESVIREISRSDVNMKTKAFQTILKNRTFHGGILAEGAGFIKYGENGKGIRSRWYPSTLAKRFFALSLIADRIDFRQEDGLDVISEYSKRTDVIFFIDPPYTVGGKKAGERLYRHSNLNHERLFSICETIKGDFLMTYDNVDEVKTLARHHGFQMRLVPMNNTHHAMIEELVIGKELSWMDQYPAVHEPLGKYGTK